VEVLEACLELQFVRDSHLLDLDFVACSQLITVLIPFNSIEFELLASSPQKGQLLLQSIQLLKLSL